MLNRNAEALFWMGRYMERAENHARLIDVHYHLQAEHELGLERSPDHLERIDSSTKWMRIVEALGSRSNYEEQYGAFTEIDVLLYMTLDWGNENSIVSCVSHARGNLRTLREKVPSELWDSLNGFYLWLRECQPDDLLRESPHTFFGRIKDWAALFLGLCQSVMPRENEWHFIECGRYLERAENTLRILKSTISAACSEGWSHAASYPYLQAVLKSVSGHQAFRRYYADGIAIEAIFEFVILNAVFPRSVQFSLHSLDEHLRLIELQDKTLRTQHDRMIRQVGKVKADLACLEQDDFMLLDSNAVLVNHLFDATQQLGVAFAKTFFRLGEASA
ncbi:hypothetical protein BVG16_02865 [Paenibacillus selenitireducens]|uniref:DUF403 domain-containing protein n=1 Tax=Paenibacillus selenitireducens TaxID=1324314 RepID=A0A1T2XP98_9BACL|nr:alpha-E domain-containing protein [Paenibacillus selenitireducens]OPA81546.1 hypothetical protein BVG16_02865 [Paenibacillus selenitireducens]